MKLENQIIDKLKSIEDPELRVDIYSLKLVYDIELDEKRKSVKMKFRPTAYQCPVGIQLALSVKRALMEIEELTAIDIDVIDFIMANEANKYLKSLDSEIKNKTKEE